MSGDATAQARAAVCACARELWERRLVTGTSGNVSARLADGSIVVTPTRLALWSLAPAQLAHVDANGTVLNGDARPSSELPLHLAAYRAQPHATFVVHTHPTYCVVWAGTGGMFPRETVAARESLAPIAWVPYAPPGSRELADATAAALRDGAPLALLERHGLVAVTSDWETAFVQTDLAEECARVAYLGARFAASEQGRSAPQLG